MNSNHIKIDDEMVSIALDFLPDYMRTHENFCKLIELQAERYQQLDVELVKLAYYRLLDEAQGVVLDGIGSEVNVPRRGQTDDEYRAFIKLRFLRRSTEPTRIGLVKLLTIMSGGAQPLIYKGRKRKVHAILPRRCMDSRNVGLELEDTFPINTNLSVSSSSGIPLVASKRGESNDRYGKASSRNKIAKQGRVTSLMYSTYYSNFGD